MRAIRSLRRRHSKSIAEPDCGGIRDSCVVRSGSEKPRAAVDCSTKAMDLLARRPHFRRQLAEKLGRRGFEEADIRRVCDEFEERGYLDDLACARSLANGELRRKRYGPKRLRFELSKRGAPDDVVAQIVDVAFAEGEEALLDEAVTIWLKSHRWKRDALARYLERRGFSGSAIWKAVDEAADALAAALS